jgi:hypothetical protein
MLGYICRVGQCIVTLLATLAFVVVSATAASAFHEVGIAQWGVIAPSGFLGADAVIRQNCLAPNDPTTEAISHELWVINNQNANYWVEAGIKKGKKDVSAGGGYLSTPQLFWADQRPSGPYGGYIEHDPGIGVPANTLHETRIVSDGGSGSTAWFVQFPDDGYLSESTSNFAAPSREIETGAESYSADGYSYGSSTGMTYITLQDTEITGWHSSGSGNARLVIGTDMFAGWPDSPPSYSWLRYGEDSGAC